MGIGDQGKRACEAYGRYNLYDERVTGGGDAL